MEEVNPEAWLSSEFRPVAVYFSATDCVEYVNEDTVYIYERIDQFLTLIYDETKFRVIGFKIKGFRWIFEHCLKAHLQLNQSDFIDLVQAIEAICQQLGDELTADDRRLNAYRAARKIADNDNAELWASPELTASNY